MSILNIIITVSILYFVVTSLIIGYDSYITTFYTYEGKCNNDGWEMVIAEMLGGPFIVILMAFGYLLKGIFIGLPTVIFETIRIYEDKQKE